MASALLDVFDMDLTYFQTHVPVTADIIQIMMAAGWALLIGNLAFQAMRAMASGLGFEGEDPQILFTRTFVFSFLLMASRQICNIGLTLTGRVIDLVGIPNTITINTPTESNFGSGDSTWLLVVIVGLILIFQIIRFFFEIAERYVVLATLTIMAPLAFGMGGSKSTEDIFKGWARMYGSMCVMMLMNVVFLKLLLSAMATIPTGAGVLPWMLFVVAIARVARKVDDLVCRIGLNPARTGDPLGRGLPLMVTMAMARSMGRTVAATVGGRSGAKAGQGGSGGKAGAAGRSPRPGSPQNPGGKSAGGSGSGSSRRGEKFSQILTTNPTSSPGQSPAKGTASQGTPAPGQPAAKSAEKFSPVRSAGQQQKPPLGRAAPAGKRGGEKPSSTTSGDPSPKPTRPPLRGKNATPPPAQGQKGTGQPSQMPQKNPLPSQGAGEHTGTHTESATSQTRRQSESKTISAGAVQNPPVPGGVSTKETGQGAKPTRPSLQRSGNPPQESPANPRKNGAVAGSGEVPPASRRNDPVPGPAPKVSGEARSASRKNGPPQGMASAVPKDAPPAPRRNGDPPHSAPSAGESRPSSRRNEGVPGANPPVPQPQPPGPSRNTTSQVAPQAAPQPPSPRRNAAPQGAAPRTSQPPRRPPLNQERGGSK